MLDPVNLFSPYVKYYIWMTRCRKFIPIINTFLPWFKNKLKIELLSSEPNRYQYSSPPPHPGYKTLLDPAYSEEIYDFNKTVRIICFDNNSAYQSM